MGSGVSSVDRGPDLKLQVGPLRCVRSSHGAHDLAGRHLSTLRDVDLFKVKIQRIKTSTVAQPHRQTVPFEGARVSDRTGLHGPYGSSGGRPDPDSVPPQYRAVRSLLSPESIDQLAVHWPVHRSHLRRREPVGHAPPGGGSLDFHPSCFELGDEDAHAGLVDLELFHPVGGGLPLGTKALDRPAMRLFHGA